MSLSRIIDWGGCQIDSKISCTKYSNRYLCYDICKFKINRILLQRYKNLKGKPILSFEIESDKSDFEGYYLMSKQRQQNILKMSTRGFSEKIVLL